MPIKQKYFKWRALPLIALSASLFSYPPHLGAENPRVPTHTDSVKVAISWQSRAKLHHSVGSERGDILMGADGVEFRSEKGRTLKWPFLEIKTFSLSAHSLAIETYTNRNRYQPGMQRYRFDLDQAVPPELAAGLARQVQRPSRNLIPDPASQIMGNVPAHHRMRSGGTNGTLRFREEGIDYMTSVAGDNRSWRWADLQTLSKPDPYHLLVFGYRDTYAFDLKETVSQSLFNWLTDEVASHNVAQSGQTP